MDSWGTFPEAIRDAATELELARAGNYQIQPLSVSDPSLNLNQSKGYQIAAALRVLRESKHGHVVAGRKMGFTNRNIWPEYNIDASNWSYIYRDTTIDLTEEPNSKYITFDKHSVEIDISHISALQPKIEPEIVVCLSRPISPSMDDRQILQSIEWLAHGFEIVASIFPDWKFAAADTTAAFALHGMLLVGPKVFIEQAAIRTPEELLETLKSFNLTLYQNGNKVDEGTGSNVLGSPVKALRHLAELLEQDEFNKALAAGEIITTGTLTRALDIQDGDVWSTKISGIELSGLQVSFKME